ncbi:MAG TPA: carboxypeptidase-like regulatory domain-containing protein, partial [Candidatus Dormibacteraeota bacterium]|nr:carboxypeptidase-like regulatory domain-containing protein [Candidatus Dormibacteraeota bacterium]
MRRVINHPLTGNPFKSLDGWEEEQVTSRSGPPKHGLARGFEPSSQGKGAYGQGGATGAISGSVVDTSGGSVAGADVQIIDTRTEAVVRKLPVGSDGSFLVPLLPPGTYSVVVNKSGFTEAKADGIEVRVTETTKVTITLKPGAVSEEVEISAQITTVDTTRATTGQSLSTETVRQLPLATQNFQQLLTLSSGAQDRLNNATQLGRGDVRVFVNTST